MSIIEKKNRELHVLELFGDVPGFIKDSEIKGKNVADPKSKFPAVKLVQELNQSQLNYLLFQPQPQPKHSHDTWP